jgi:hypothetical protein
MFGYDDTGVHVSNLEYMIKESVDDTARATPTEEEFFASLKLSFRI